jgi:hypothetical protein
MVTTNFILNNYFITKERLLQEINLVVAFPLRSKRFLTTYRELRQHPHQQPSGNPCRSPP